MNKDFLTGLIGILRYLEVGEASANCICNTKEPVPTKEELIKWLRFKISRTLHPSYIQVYKAICGWQTVLMVWDEEGFYDTWTTGMGPYGHTKKGYDRACKEAKNWAKNDDVPQVHIPKYTKGRE